MKHSTPDSASIESIVTHPLDAEDGAAVATMRASARPAKGMLRDIEARGAFDAMMEGILSRDDVTFEQGSVGGVPGLWVYPIHWQADEALLHLHAGWFSFGSAKAFRHFVAHIAARVGARAFIPDYRLAPEQPFPAAPDDVYACYLALEAAGIRRIAVTGDSAGGNLALVLAARVAGQGGSAGTSLVGVAVLSPVTDLTLSGASYETRADADPIFTRPQVTELVRTYLGNSDPIDPLASPLLGRVEGLPGVRIHVGDDEVLLDDSRRYVERAVAAGVDARLDVWTGMAHGFAGSVGRLKASAQALDALGSFLAEKLGAGNGSRGTT